MTQMSNISARMTPIQVAELMGLEEGFSLPPVAWLVIQEEAAGVTRAMIAKTLNVTIEALDELRDAITGKEGEESVTTWQQGIVALKTAEMLNTRQIGTGWDAIEAMAVNKLANQLTNMKTDGDPDMMLKIAAAANKATRRHKGEGQGQRVGIQVNANVANGDANVELQGGHLGSIRLNLSPRIQAQLGNPSRVIDVTPRQVNGESSLNLQMLKLGETRNLADKSQKEHDQSRLDEKNEALDAQRMRQNPYGDLAKMFEDIIDS